MSISLLILIWACGAVALIALAIRNGSNRELTLADVMGIAWAWPLVLVILPIRKIKAQWKKAVWRRKP